METVLTIFGYNISYLELIGSIFNLAAVILATKANIWNWISSFIAQLCFFFLFWYNGLYGNAILQIYFTYICIISIIRWRKTDNMEDKGLIWMSTKLRIKTTILNIGFIILGWLLLSNIGVIFPSLKSLNPLMDVTIMVMSITGVNLISRKYIESWIVWMINDIICIGLFFATGVYIVGIEYIIITGITVYGLMNWIKIKNKI